MSSMAYENSKSENDNQRMEIDREKFRDNFTSMPMPDEVEKGYDTGPLFPQADIDLRKIVKEASKRELCDSKW